MQLDTRETLSHKCCLCTGYNFIVVLLNQLGLVLDGNLITVDDLNQGACWLFEIPKKSDKMEATSGCIREKQALASRHLLAVTGPACPLVRRHGCFVTLCYVTSLLVILRCRGLMLYL